MKKFLSIFGFIAALLFGQAYAQSNFTYTLGGTVSANDRVYLSGATALQATASTEDIGIATIAGVSGDTIEVIQYSPADIARFKADGVIAAGVDVYPAASGLVTATVQGKRIGKSLNATTTSGDIVKVVIMPTGNDRVVINKAFNASSVDEWIFICDKAYKVVSIKCVYSVAGGSSAAVKARKVTDVSAPGAAAGTTVKEFCTAAFDLTATANTVQTGTLSATATDYTLASGDKIGLDFSGTLTALAGGIVTIELKVQ